MAKANYVELMKSLDIPSQLNDNEVITYVRRQDIGWKYILRLQQLTSFKDEIISDWLNISVRTLRTYKNPGSTLKQNLQEQVVLLISLIQYGIDVFGSSRAFEDWLLAANFFFDQKPPLTYLNTVSGIRFVNDRLIAMEHGDNV
jgi:uncharacterized protein (DUF2384 family)